MKLKEEEGIDLGNSKGWIWLVILAILVVMFFLGSVWQAFQSEWVVQPGQTLTIRWHKCLSAGGASVVLTPRQIFTGIMYDNTHTNQAVPIRVCD